MEVDSRNVCKEGRSRRSSRVRNHAQHLAARQTGPLHQWSRHTHPEGATTQSGRETRAPLELRVRLPNLAAASEHRVLHALKQLLRAVAEAQQGEAARRVHAVAGADAEHAAAGRGQV